VRALAADGLRLEPQVATHAAELYPVLADPALYVFTDDKGPTDEAALTGRLRHLESRRSPDGAEQWLNWVVRTSDCGVVGYVQATVRAGSEAEIAYMLGRAFWRRGYATIACSLMLSELFQAYSVRRVTATLDPRNGASLALLRKLGFRFVREERAAGEITYGKLLGP